MIIVKYTLLKLVVIVFRNGREQKNIYRKKLDLLEEELSLSGHV